MKFVRNNSIIKKGIHRQIVEEGMENHDIISDELVMYKRTEYLIELERLEYELESKKMELTGLYKEYSEIKKSIIYYMIPLFILFVFYTITVGQFHTSSEHIIQAFSIVLNPIYIFIFFVCLAVIVKRIWFICLNLDFEYTRKLSEKFNHRSVSKEIDRCKLEITKIEMRINDLSEKLSDESPSLCIYSKK